MITFTTVLGASGTLIASGIADKILNHYGKNDLAETLRVLTHMGAVGYGAYFVLNVLVLASHTFL